MNPYLIIVALVVLGAATSGAGYLGYRAGSEHEVAAQVRQDAAVAAMQTAVAEAISKIEVKNVTVRQQLATEIREKPVYRDCRMDNVGLRLINEAITGSAGDSQLPADRAADRSQLRGDSPEAGGVGHPVP